ncbi:MAG: MarR family transcriptional regulator [Eubacteriales bacterium]|nr:MarR family transcriptional regulator [Eubacteriales bacterium]
MTAVTELLLDSYLRFSTAISNERVVSELPYNEALICNLLYRRFPQTCTATELCDQTRMQKSQMARTLNEMEEKRLIVRSRSREDRRQVAVALNREGADAFFRQHSRTLALVQAISEKMAPDRVQALARLLDEAADAAREVLG